MRPGRVGPEYRLQLARERAERAPVNAGSKARHQDVESQPARIVFMPPDVADGADDSAIELRLDQAGHIRSCASVIDLSRVSRPSVLLAEIDAERRLTHAAFARWRSAGLRVRAVYMTPGIGVGGENSAAGFAVRGVLVGRTSEPAETRRTPRALSLRTQFSFSATDNTRRPTRKPWRKNWSSGTTTPLKSNMRCSHRTIRGRDGDRTR